MKPALWPDRHLCRCSFEDFETIVYTAVMVRSLRGAQFAAGEVGAAGRSLGLVEPGLASDALGATARMRAAWSTLGRGDLGALHRRAARTVVHSSRPGPTTNKEISDVPFSVPKAPTSTRSVPQHSTTPYVYSTTDHEDAWATALPTKSSPKPVFVALEN